MIIPTAVTIGFEEDTVEVPEEAGEVIVRASLLEGVLATDVDVQLDCTSGQATGKKFIKQIIYMYMHVRSSLKTFTVKVVWTFS